MNVSLTPQLEAWVREKVESGRYNSSSEVIREALRLLEQFDGMQQAKLEALRADIKQAQDSFRQEGSAFWSVEDTIRRGHERHAEHA